MAIPPINPIGAANHKALDALCINRRGIICGTATTIRAEDSVEQKSWDECESEYRIEIGVGGIGSVKRVGEIVLQRGLGTGGKIPEEHHQHGGVDRFVL